jgi:hypothetical protein
MKAATQQQFYVAFYLCGLTSGIQASFSPEVAPPTTDPTSPTYFSARTSLSITVPFGTAPGLYNLAVRGRYARTPTSPADGGPSLDSMSPQTAILTIHGDGSASLVPSSFETSITGQTCTSLPPAFAVTPTPTLSPTDVQVSARISNAHPAPGEFVTVYGTITVRGQPAGASMLSKWYLPTGIKPCYNFTNAQGVASCTMQNNNPYPGWVVIVQLIFTYNGQNYLTSTSYTM